jgi:hypothetical protein
MKNRFESREILCVGMDGVNSPGGGFVNNVKADQSARLNSANETEALRAIAQNLQVEDNLSGVFKTMRAAGEFAQV